MIKKESMTEGSLWNKILGFAFPLAMTGILQQAFNAADIAVVGNFTGELGEACMAAVGANTPIINFIINGFLGISLGTNVVIANAVGSKDDETVQNTEEAIEEIEAGKDTLSAMPFIVPKGIDLTMYTNLSEINFNDHLFNNVGGDVTIKDGVAILQELGFSSDAAEMQLTAIYRTPSPQDDPFIELDFHLLDIEIDELIDLIPSVDSIVPMLKAFSGQANFHLAAETFLKDNTPIMSTLLGAAAIDGKNLVLLDNEVFDGIKRKLLMSKNAQNVIDSIDVQMQVIRNRVTLYPSRVHMDRYTAIIDGRHFINKDLDCKYTVSLIDSPLPISLGVSISGSINDIAESPIKHIRLVRPQYNKLYIPDKQSRTDEIIMELKNNIQDVLRSNVR